MKKLLTLLTLIVTPLSFSCAKEVHYQVNIVGEGAKYDSPIPEAIRGMDYYIEIEAKDGYIPFDRSNFVISNRDFSFIDERDYSQNTHILTIPGKYITSDILITVEADTIDE